MPVHTGSVEQRRSKTELMYASRQEMSAQNEMAIRPKQITKKDLRNKGSTSKGDMHLDDDVAKFCLKVISVIKNRLTVQVAIKKRAMQTPEALLAPLNQRSNEEDGLPAENSPVLSCHHNLLRPTHSQPKPPRPPPSPSTRLSLHPTATSTLSSFSSTSSPDTHLCQGSVTACLS